MLGAKIFFPNIYEEQLGWTPSLLKENQRRPLYEFLALKLGPVKLQWKVTVVLTIRYFNRLVVLRSNVYHVAMQLLSVPFIYDVRSNLNESSYLMNWKGVSLNINALGVYIPLRINIQKHKSY